MKELRKTLCNRDCPDACGIVATVEEGRVTALRGDREHPMTRGFLCHRTSRFLERQYSPDRLLAPLFRESLDDDFREIGWDEALDRASERLLAIRDESGPSAIFHYRCGGSLGLLVTLTDTFFERFGPVTIKRGDICDGAGGAAQEADFGVSESSDVHALLDARQVILWGKNPYTSSPHLLPILREAKARGAGVVVVDPVRHRSALLADRYVQVRPGGDTALAMAVARLLFDAGRCDPLAAEYCENLDAMRALATRRTVAEWCAEAAVTPEDAQDLAERLSLGRPATILVGWGMARRLNGAAIVRSVDALAAISGNVGLRGAGASFYFRRSSAFDTSFRKGLAVAPRTVCEPLLGPELLRLTDPPVRAVWVTAANPVAMLPESLTTERALRSRDFVVVVDSFLTDTARCAHLVLPTTTLLEADDLVGAYGHHYIGVSRPVVPRPDGVRSDLEIMQGLAARTGLEEELRGTAREWKQRMMVTHLVPRGVTVETLEAGVVRNPLGPRIVFEGRRFSTPSGRARLLNDLSALPASNPDFPLLLMALSTPESQSSQWVAPQEGPAVLTVHPDSASGIPDEGLGCLESAIASMTVRVRHDATQRRDVALVPKGGHLATGHCANALVRARLTDEGEGGALYDEPVRLVAKERAG